MAETKSNKPAKASLKVRVAKFFREYRSEIKKISWSKPSQTINNTWVVIVCSAAFAVAIGLVDLLVSKGIVSLGNLF